MTSWTELPKAVYDSETTSKDPLTDKLVTGFLGLINGSNVTRQHWTANPGIPISPEATQIHGYDDAYVQKHGRPHGEVVDEIVNGIYDAWNTGHILVGYNLSFDLSLIAANAPHFEIRGPIFDAFVIDKQYDRFRKGSRKLSAVCIHYGMRLDDAHDAEGDAMAAGRLAWKMPRLYPDLANYTADQLTAQQATWHSQQAESLIKYLKSQERPYGDVRREWPIVTQRAQAA